MEVVSKNALPLSYKNALQLENDGQPAQAEKMYEQLLKKDVKNLKLLSRLIIVCRKLKKYNKEIGYIDQIIKIHEEKYHSLKQKDQKVVTLSKQLNTALGHTDKRGKNLLELPEVITLKKRKEVALKRMQAKKR